MQFVYWDPSVFQITSRAISGFSFVNCNNGWLLLNAEDISEIIKFFQLKCVSHTTWKWVLFSCHVATHPIMHREQCEIPGTFTFIGINHTIKGWEFVTLTMIKTTGPRVLAVNPKKISFQFCDDHLIIDLTELFTRSNTGYCFVTYTG